MQGLACNKESFSTPLARAHIQSLNACFPNLEVLYYHVSLMRNTVLPSIKAKAITMKYLLGVFDLTYYSFQQTNYKVCILLVTAKLRKQRLAKKIEAQSKKILRFDSRHLPQKIWLIDVLYSINSTNEAFKSISTSVERIISKE